MTEPDYVLARVPPCRDWRVAKRYRHIVISPHRDNRVAREVDYFELEQSRCNLTFIIQHGKKVNLRILIGVALLKMRLATGEREGFAGIFPSRAAAQNHLRAAGRSPAGVEGSRIKRAR